MDLLQPYIPYAWILVLVLVFLTYIVLDGLISGIGILSFWIKDQKLLRDMTESFSGVWHTHQTWLVLFAGLLFGSYPAVFGKVLSLLYLPVSLFILGFFTRGLAIEFLELKEPRRLWTFFYALGSVIQTLSQAMVLVLILQIIVFQALLFPAVPSMTTHLFTFGLSLILVFSYLLFGLIYLIQKTSGENQLLFYKLSSHTGMFLVATTILLLITLSLPKPQHPFLLYSFLGLIVVSSLLFFRGIALKKGRVLLPLFLMCFLSLVAAYLTTYPKLLEALAALPVFVASPRSQFSLLIIFCIMLPVIILYNILQYRVFRGKVDENGKQNY